MKYLIIVDSENHFTDQLGAKDLCVDSWFELPDWSPLNSESEAAARKIIEGMRPKK